ncbi:MAG TPA: antibiotic biosynthesis monooxygenase family protein [Terriglobales bacterium]|nr:antibiotic biosynthesis monooxygenase family protein [Terriglobales bacterium]
MSYIVIWEFQVRPGAEVEFERVYGRDGDWARLFRQAEGFIRTELLRDHEVRGRYLVLDHWGSAAQYDAFRAAHAAEYAALDQRCEALTLREARIGSFSELP